MRKRVLIGGSSLAGKSGLAAGVGERLGWEVVATDYLARHPGRPWRDDGSEVPPHVVEHFVSLTPEALLADVLRHYRSLSARILEIAAGDGLVIEGSAVLPELMPRVPGAFACVIVAGPGVLTGRIMRCAHPSPLAALPQKGEVLSEAAMKFAARAELMNAFVSAEAERLGVQAFDAERVSVEEVVSCV